MLVAVIRPQQGPQLLPSAVFRQLSNYWIRRPYDMKNSADLGVRLERSKMFRRQFPHFGLTTKTTQPRPQVFSINGSIACNRLHF